MADFKWDKTKYENADEIEKLVEQAIQYGSKNTEKKISEVEKTYKQQLDQLATELNGVKNQSKLNELLSGVPEKNKKVISTLINNDPDKIDEVKTNYSHLFEKDDAVNLKDILVNGNIPNNQTSYTGEQLKDRYEKNIPLTEDEEKMMWAYLQEQTK